ncbi:MAG TPA: helix-hairpin-helix domain-containing protein [Nitriliruptorales bacterium]|nr:helix-hairpin-helix domain-containing protein [Nitriliruptorales bacterium]
MFGWFTRLLGGSPSRQELEDDARAQLESAAGEARHRHLGSDRYPGGDQAPQASGWSTARSSDTGSDTAASWQAQRPQPSRPRQAAEVATVDRVAPPAARQVRTAAPVEQSIHERLGRIEGVGPARQAALLERFGSLEALRAATAEELASVQGIGDRTARRIVASLDANGRG